MFSKETRQEIIRDFAARHGGEYDARLFLDEVRNSNGAHPAYEWFEWDAEKAAGNHQLWQARKFASGLRVTFSVETLNRGSVVVNVPLAMSPLDGRGHGGGYFVTDPKDPAHMAEFCAQAATALRGWVERYGSALDYAQGSKASISRALKALDAIPEREAA